MNKIYIFDVDGTLTPSRQSMTMKIYSFFKQWSLHNKFYLVTGSDVDKTKEQISDDVFDLAGLYGMFYSKKLLDYYPNFVDAPINTAVLNASKKIITVPNAEVGDQLAKSGLLLQGEIVLNQQTGRPLPIGFNEEYWESDIGQNLLKQFVEQM